ncbi:uncharacterized protein LOC132695650 [Cylas formicarius]|uniref:uncharacterized protein LOC132695650 n=1 Tax=Cylas formicarius TaxID=197179 RepID=UPI0029585D70|nr:uncharacterized protein LOC132695650 [Cylas formicarius]
MDSEVGVKQEVTEMDFFELVQKYFNRLGNFNIVTKLYKEVMIGRERILDSEESIAYSFHYPVDTILYFEDLNAKFDECPKELFRTMNGELKGYLLTFIYYCLVSRDRTPTKAGLLCGKLYLKILLMPEIGTLFFERYIYIATLNICTQSLAEQTRYQQITFEVIELIFEYCNRLGIVLFTKTANMFSKIIILKNEEEYSDLNTCKNFTNYCFWCLKQLISKRSDRVYLRGVLAGILRFLIDEEPLQPQCVAKFKKFLCSLFKDFDDSKLQYIVDAIFLIWESPKFALKECVETLNLLEEIYYKDIIRKIPNYLESKNHVEYHFNLMDVIYQMMLNPPAISVNKLVAYYSLCWRAVTLHLLSRDKSVQTKAIETVSNIFAVQNDVVNTIFRQFSANGIIATLTPNDLLVACSFIIRGKCIGNAAKIRNIFIIVSRLLLSIDNINAEIGSQIIYSLCNHATPFSLKPLLGHLNALYLKLHEKNELLVCNMILKIFLKNALHQDATSEVFAQHLYKKLVYPDELDGKVYPPECFSNVFLKDDFEYQLLFNKCQHLIRYEDVEYTIQHFNHMQPGHSVLLQSLLQFVNYKNHHLLTCYIIQNFGDLCVVENSGVLFDAYGTILKNERMYHPLAEMPNFETIHDLIWNSLYQQRLIICSIKSAFALTGILRTILKKEEPLQDTLLTDASEKAYRSLTSEDRFAGCVMYLTELCVTLKKNPPQEIMDIFENVIETPETLNLLRTQRKDMLIQLIAFFATFAMMNKNKIPSTVKLLIHVLDTDDVIVKITAMKLLFTICMEITHDFEEVTEICFRNITKNNPCLSKICVVFLEELINNNYVLLNSEDFLKFIYGLACSDLHYFMKYVLNNRFMLSNKNDISKYYIPTIVYLSDYRKFDNYPVSAEFDETLKQIQKLTNYRVGLMSFLFASIPTKDRFHILTEFSSIYEVFVTGRANVDLKYFEFLKYSLLTFKVICDRIDFNYKSNFYEDVCEIIEKQILKKDNNAASHTLFFYEYEPQIRRCTKSLLKMMIYIKMENLMSEMIFPIFDTLMCWIWHTRAEIIRYTHFERGKDYEPYLIQLMRFYRANKEHLNHLLDIQER